MESTVFRRYANHELGISIALPLGWSVEELDERSFVTSSPPHAEFDAYRSSLSYTLAEFDQSEPDWFEGAIRESEATQRRFYADYRLIHQERFQLGDQPAYLRHCRWQQPGIDVYSAHFQGLYWPGGEHVIVSKGATLQPFEKRQIPLMEAIFRSTEKLGS